MPSFVAALLVAPSSSSVGTSSLVPAASGSDLLGGGLSESAYERRKSIAGGATVPSYRLGRNPPSLDRLPMGSSNQTRRPFANGSSSSSMDSQSPSLPVRSTSTGGRGGKSASKGRVSLGGFPSLDPPSDRAIADTHTTQAHPSPHRPQQGYADFLERALRDGGIPVSNLRTLNQVQSHLDLSTNLPLTPTSPEPNPSLFQPSFSLAPPPSSEPVSRSSSSSSSQTSQAFILLLPLNDLAPSTLATARLIRESGKTPSSICFDLEHEVGEKEWERTFVEALAVIEHVQTMRASWGKRVLVAAYSADPDITPEAIQRCRDAGADAVLYPPFNESAATIEHLQQTLSSNGQELNSFTFPSGLSRPSLRSRVSPPHPLSQLDSPPDTPPSPPTTGSQPTPCSSSFEHEPSSSSSRAARFDPFPSAEAPTPTTSVFSFLSADDAAGPRRASVDTGGLALALDRVDRLGSDGWMAEDDDGERAEADVDTSFAEVLAEMHCQTRFATDGQTGPSPNLFTPVSDRRRAELIGLLSSWHFAPHKLSTEDLHHCSCILFEATLMIDGLWQLDIPLAQIHRFLFSLQNIYHAPNPYHNAIHALDVAQATYSFLAAAGVVPPFGYLLQVASRRPSTPWTRLSPAEGVGRDERAKEVLRPQDVFALMVAAIGHDVAHPGLSNVFMKNAQTPISEVYSNSSALENMHCCIVVTLLRKHGFAFLFPSTPSSAELTPRPRRPHSLPPTPPLSDVSDAPPPAFSSPSAVDWTDFRSILSASILSTDMAMHFGWITRLVELGQRLAAEKEGESLAGGVALNEDELARHDRVMICQTILKCADISNPTRPAELSQHWSSVLLDEWTNQATLETGLDLPVSVISNASAALQAKGQVGFLNLFVCPLFTASAAVIPQMSVYVQRCDVNLATWTHRLQTLTASETPLPISPAPIPTPSSPAPSDTTVVPFDVDSPYRSLFPLTLPSTLLMGDGAGSESGATSTTCGGTDQHRRRAMQAGKNAGLGLPPSKRWKREKRARRRSADGSPLSGFA